MTSHERNQCKTSDEYYSLLSKKFEQAGILVFKSGLVSSNQTRKGLSVSEFRGFAVADKIVPVIFINGKDSPAALVFTLAHEAAHIWMGESGVSDGLASQIKINPVELLCNRVAGELLVPETDFFQAWNRENSDPIETLSKQFKVSRLVVARRAFDLGKIDWQSCQRVEELTQAALRKESKKSTPIPKTTTLPIQNSRRFTRALVESAMGGQTMLLEAARLLNTSPKQIMALANKN